MSSVNYSLNNKGVRLIPAEKAWTNGKNGKRRLNSKYRFVGKVQFSMPNMVITVYDNKKPKYKGDVSELNRTAKGQIIEHFYDEKGKRNRKTVAYFGIEKKTAERAKSAKK